LADALAARLGGEVLSADSMQVYRGMDIGTAKMPPEERSVPYHCIDLVDPGVPFTAALYQRAARTAIDGLLAAGKPAVLCGGTGLYLRAALDGFDFDEKRETDAAPAAGDIASPLRERLQQQAAILGPERFHALLAERDPASAELIHPNNVRRVVRALELLEQGASYAGQHAGFAHYEAIYPVLQIGLSVQPEVLYQAIELRVEAMLAAGLLEEVEGLLDAGFEQAVTAQQAIGYKELVPVLRAGRPLAEAVDEIKRSTRRYAKRQRTWFKRDPRIKWLDATELHEALMFADFTEAEFTMSLLQRALLLVE
jgi:tRNA dimethylallyltransferase